MGNKENNHITFINLFILLLISITILLILLSPFLLLFLLYDHFDNYLDYFFFISIAIIIAYTPCKLGHYVVRLKD